jgi:hypothetical protein
VPTMHLIKYVHSQKSEKSNTFKVFEGKGYPKVFEVLCRAEAAGQVLLYNTNTKNTSEILFKMA